jgi:hypothetical protein
MSAGGAKEPGRPVQTLIMKAKNEAWGLNFTFFCKF